MDVTPALAKEIVLRYRKRTGGAPSPVGVTAELAAFIARVSLFASPEKDEKGNVALTPEAIEVLAEDLSAFLAGCSPHVIATFSLQCCAHGVRAAVLKRRRAEAVRQEAITVRLLTSLCESTAHSPEEILAEIVFFILHRYGLAGGEGNGSARRETASILSSVLPRAQVRAFAAQPSDEKRRQLEELRRVVWGLRVFHCAEGRGTGAGVREPHEFSAQRIAAAAQRAEAAAADAAQQCAAYAAALKSPSAAAVERSGGAALREEYQRLLQRRIVSQRAAQRCADVSARVRDVLLPAYDAALSALRPLLGAGSTRADGLSLRDAVPKRVVFPPLVALADAYEEAHDALCVLDEADALLDAADALGRVAAPSLPPALAAEAAANERADAACAPFESLAAEAALWAPRALWAPSAEAIAAAGHCAASAPALSGLCPVALAEDGVALEGRAEGDAAFAGFAVLPHPDGSVGRGKWFALRSEVALRKFAARPAHYLSAAERMAQDDWVLVGLLDLFDSVPREIYIRGTRQYEPRWADAADGFAAVKHDAAVQTGHADPYMDHNYRWNEWDLRRQALKLANLFNMRTHSTQTIASHFRRDNATQARPPRDGETQTMQDAAVQPPRTLRFLKGMRGTESSAIETVERVFQY